MFKIVGHVAKGFKISDVRLLQSPQMHSTHMLCIVHETLLSVCL